MGRLIVIANRLPVSVEEIEGQLVTRPSAGGLATGMSSLEDSEELIWIGWPGEAADDNKTQNAIARSMPENYHPVHLSSDELELFYEGFSNETLWPLFHSLVETVRLDGDCWQCYESINRRYFEKLKGIIQPGDKVWIHDYHLLLLPALVKEAFPEIPVGLFLHIPFPPEDVFRTLPQRRQILLGMLGADLLGFHTSDYVNNFSNSVYRLLGFKIMGNNILSGSSLTRVDVFPMGIDFYKFYNACDEEEVRDVIRHYRKVLGDVKLILSVDRLDYTKGILPRLDAMEQLLETYPEYIQELTLLMIVVPSRTGVDSYAQLKEEIDRRIGEINGKFGTISWKPVHYYYRSVDFDHLAGLYNLADVGLVTSIRDGMNLVAKEYVASKKEHTGVLILSEMAGSFYELSEATRLNPFNTSAIVEAIRDAVELPEDIKRERIQNMQNRLKENSVFNWSSAFIKGLQEIGGQKKRRYGTQLEKVQDSFIRESINSSIHPLVVLDYDGTLRAFTKNPDEAAPDTELMPILEQLQTMSSVYILSGRDHVQLEQWFGHTDIGLIGEHGMAVKMNGQWEHESYVELEWKSRLTDVMRPYLDKLPGSAIEEKTHGLAFHYREVEQSDMDENCSRLVWELTAQAGRYDLELLHGNKVIELRHRQINKGMAVRRLLKENNWDFIMAIGDDITDEEMFVNLPSGAFTIKVGVGPTFARFRLCDSEAVLKFLKSMCGLKCRHKKVYSGDPHKQINPTKDGVLEK